MQDLKISIIGAGNLGKSIAEGLLKAEYIKPQNLYLTRRRIHLVKELEEKGIHVGDNNAEAAKNSQIIIIAVKPYQVVHLLEEIKPVLNPEKHIIVSVATGINLSDIQKITGKMPVFRAMPNTAMAIRESMTCISSASATAAHEKMVLDLFNQLGQTIGITEELMGASTVLGACGIAFALRFMRAMTQGGIEIGFGSEISQLIAAQTIKGAADLILQSGNHPEREIDKVTTPQGITISGLNEMEHQGFSSSVIKGLITSYSKIEKMKKGK